MYQTLQPRVRRPCAGSAWALSCSLLCAGPATAAAIEPVPLHRDDPATARVLLADGSARTDSLPVAKADSVSTGASTAVTVPVLANDAGLADAPLVVTVSAAPAAGEAAVNADGTITYTPNAVFYGNDSFTYQVSDADGDAAVASVAVAVTCSGGCESSDYRIRLSWLPNPDPVSGYTVLHGGSAATATQPLSDLPVGSPGFDATAPAVAYSARADLGVAEGGTVCFSVRAYNEAGASAPGTAVCARL